MRRLDGARIKLERANRHIAELVAAATHFLSTAPFYLQPQDAENGDLITIVRIRSHVPPAWAAIVGDAVHNMRSALDLVAWQAVEAAGGRPGRDTCFPIGVASRTKNVEAIRRNLAGAALKAMKFARRLRPYKGGNDKLTQLHALDVVDKHRLILVVGAATNHVVLKLRVKFSWQVAPMDVPPVALTPADRQFPLDDGVEVFRISKAARDSGATSQLTNDVVFELAFGVMRMRFMVCFLSRLFKTCTRTLRRSSVFSTD